MESSFAIAILAVIHGLIFLALIAILLSDRWRRARFRRRRLSRRESRTEQLLVAESIASCVLEKNLESLVRALGKRAAELNGFEEWIVWLGDGQGNFRPAGEEGERISALAGKLRDVGQDQFFDWVRNNGTPMLLEPKAEAMASAEAVREVLRRLTPGLLIPFLDGEKLVGVLLLGGMLKVRERRSEQFLTLYGAFAAILIRKVVLDEEERRLRERQLRAENLATLGKVAAGIAHEIRNPLTFIRSAAEHLSETPSGTPDAGELAAGMVEEIDRVNKRIEELLSLGRIDSEVFAPVDLEAQVRRTLQLVEAQAQAGGVEMAASFDLEGAKVAGNEDKLRQLFLNLLLNAVEAMPGGGTLKVRAERRGDGALVEVEDSGTGIPPGVADRIFEPFFTTKDGGTGLGLALCFSIAGAHGGTVELLRSGSEGTCFAVELPLAEDEPHLEETAKTLETR